MKKLMIITFITCSQGIYAQANGKKIIDKLCGCFEVSFKYAETFSPSSEYKYHDREEIAGTAELALPIEVSDKKVVIQHLLIVNDSTIVKHWREDWTYENPVIWKYQGNRTWKKETLHSTAVKGKWTQTVWEVGDEPRYQGYSQFVSLDGRIVWQNTTDAPLPRREYSVRSDYNILRRTNRLNIHDSGYLHEQDNQKIIRTNGIDKLLVEEKGHNTYKRIADSKCSAAQVYWRKNEDFWRRVRKVWADYLELHDSISLKTKIGDKTLHQYLIMLGKEYEAKKISDSEINKKIAAEITRFIGQNEKVAVREY